MWPMRLLEWWEALEKGKDQKTKWVDPFIVGEYPGPTGDGDENLCRMPQVGYYGLAKKVVLSAKPWPIHVHPIRNKHKWSSLPLSQRAMTQAIVTKAIALVTIMQNL
jgi:hypothetical protein